MWVFGYGSLVWRPGFDEVERVPGFVRGFTRRFWQASTDHRGVPAYPGRVVTLLDDDPDAITWGVASRVRAERVDAVLADLDYREKGGYERHFTTVHRPAGDAIDDVLVYVAGPSNPCFVGEEPIDLIAERVVRAVGPSGPNTEYVLRLADALRDMGVDDPHVFDLERAVRARLPDR